MRVRVRGQRGSVKHRVGGLGDRARRLRRSQTDAEGKLWLCLRGRQVNGAKFRRQHGIGRYIVDFCCVERRLVVEVDGAQHMVWTESEQRRTAFLLERGFRVLRFWDNDVLLSTAAILERIAEVLSSPSPDPSPQRGEGNDRRGEG